MARPRRAPSGLGASGAPSRFLALSHPAFLTGVALLALNDALLKPTFHSWWTGKLSDLAGVFVVAVVVGIATRRPWTADVLTSAGFAAIKLSPVAAGLVAPFLGGVTRQDATDLLALVALVPAHRFVARRVEPKHDGRPWQVPLTAAAVSLTVLSVSATSCSQLDRGVTAFAVAGDEVLAYDAGEVRPPDDLGVEHEDLDESAPDPESTPSSADPTSSTTSGRAPGSLRTWRSTDGGATWRHTDGSYPDKAPPGEVVSGEQACTDDARCYRVTTDEGGPFGAVLEGEPGGTWRVSHTFDAEQARRLELGQVICDENELATGLYQSVAVVDTPRGQHVLVAMGGEGALHLSPGSDEWERVGVGYWDPTSTRWPSWFDRLGWFGAGLVAVAAVGILALTILRWREVSWGGLVALLVLATSVVVLVPIWFVFEFNGSDYGTKGLVLSGLSILAVIASLLLTTAPRAVRRSRARRAPPLWWPPEEGAR